MTDDDPAHGTSNPQFDTEYPDALTADAGRSLSDTRYPRRRNATGRLPTGTRQGGA